MLRFTSYTDEFYIQEIHNGNKKVIDHFYAFCRDYYCKTIRNCFRKKIRRPIFFRKLLSNFGKRSVVVPFS